MKFFLMVFLFSTNLFAKEFEMKMMSMSYSPSKLRVFVGDTVKWSNMTYTKHTATGEMFDTGIVKPLSISKPIQFNKPGNYVFTCTVHGTAMKGRIHVSKAPAVQN